MLRFKISKSEISTNRIGTDDLNVSSFTLYKKDILAFIVDHAGLGNNSRMHCIMDS